MTPAAPHRVRSATSLVKTRLARDSETTLSETVKNERLVFTDAYVSAWEPSSKPFMTGTITFEDLGGGKTRYTARVTHWSAADREAHEKMGFHEGWGKCTDQLEALTRTLT